MSKQKHTTSHLYFLGKGYPKFIIIFQRFNNKLWEVDWLCANLFLFLFFLILKFRRCFIIKQDLLINEQIRADKVQVIDENNEKLGVLSLNDALDLADEKKLDLVLVAPNNNPQVCKIMNYGKYKFEQSKKEKEAKKKQKSAELKEIRITPNIDTHDFDFKVKNAQKFLNDGNKVKITLKFRGREMNYIKLGEEVLNNFISALEDTASVEKKPILEGKSMFIILAQKK